MNMNNDIWVIRTLLTMIPKYAMVKIKSIKIYIKKLIEDIERKGD